jgi:hypothetical protein
MSRDEKGPAMTRTTRSRRQPVALLWAIAASAWSAACGHSGPVAPTSTLQLNGGTYFVKLNASTSSCSASAPGAGFQFGPSMPLKRDGSGATMRLSDASDAFELTGTLIGDRLSFSMSARQSSPAQAATASGVGTAEVQSDYISGTFAGDFVLAPAIFTRATFRCYATDHTLLLTRAER